MCGPGTFLSWNVVSCCETCDVNMYWFILQVVSMALHLPESLNGEYFFLCGVETLVEQFWEFLGTWVCSLYLFVI